MSTFLQLAKRLRQESGITSSSAGPTDVTTQTGEMQRVVDWVRSAWIDIQNRHFNWRWMRRAFTFDTAAGTDTYAYGVVTDVDQTGVITRFSHWWVNDEFDPPKSYLTSGGLAGQYWLNYDDLESFRRVYKIGVQTNKKPGYIAVDHQDRLLLGSNPDDIYTITGEFQRGAQILAADADVPECPTQFHDLIWHYAMEHYGYYEAAPEALARSRKQGMRLMRQLEQNQLPELTIAGPLA